MRIAGILVIIVVLVIGSATAGANGIEAPSSTALPHSQGMAHFPPVDTSTMQVVSSPGYADGPKVTLADSLQSLDFAPFTLTSRRLHPIESRTADTNRPAVLSLRI
jgi:hypothetical protein